MPRSPMTRSLEEIITARLEDFHAARLNCAESVLCIMAEYYGWDAPWAPRLATGFGGGLGAMQKTCGAYTGGLMVIGMLLGREVGGDKQPAAEAARALWQFVQQRTGAVDCAAILDDVSFADAAQQAAFRAEGGKHQTVCEPLVAAVCRYLAGAYPRA